MNRVYFLEDNKGWPVNFSEPEKAVDHAAELVKLNLNNDDREEKIRLLESLGMIYIHNMSLPKMKVCKIESMDIK